MKAYEKLWGGGVGCVSEWVGVGVGVCTTVTFEYFKSLPFSNKSQNPTYKVGGDLQCYLSLTTSLKRN